MFRSPVRHSVPPFAGSDPSHSRPKKWVTRAHGSGTFGSYSWFSIAR